MSTKVSIITINYNNKKGLERTIESVLSQTAYDSIEYVVIDGGSTDGSADVLRLYGGGVNWPMLSANPTVVFIML